MKSRSKQGLVSATVVAVWLVSTPASALGPLSVQNLKQWASQGRLGEERLKSYVLGVRDALTQMAPPGSPPRLCIRDATDRQVYNAVRAELDRSAADRQASASVFVSKQLLRVWPCGSGRTPDGTGAAPQASSPR